MAAILIIEDDPTLRRQIAQLLRLEGHLTIEAENGRAGVERARQQPPDLIVCDIMMPVLDGFGVLQALRGARSTACLPFIFLTAKVEARDLRQGMNLGADDYLTKPFDPDELLQSVRQRLARRQAHTAELSRRSEEVSLAVASTVPRELGDPLDHIDTLASLMVLRHGDAFPPMREMQQGLQAATTQMRRMVRRLNLYAQIPQLYTQRFELELTGNVPDAAAIITREAAALAGQWIRESDLAMEIGPGPVAIRESYLATLCQELIENAFKFSPAGTRVSLLGRHDRGRWSLEVVNGGPGLSAEDLANIGAFKQFWSGPRKPSGLGLGLVLVQSIVRLHGGEFMMESQPGRTVVRLFLPLE